MATTLDADLDIQRRLAAAQLPALPQVLLEVLRQCETEDSGFTEIAEVVRRDAAITARVLSVARSPYYHRGREPEGLNQCLAVLGTRTLRRIAINQAILDLFGRFGKGAFDLNAFWGHALLTALLAQELAEQLGYGRVEEAYLAGLLHDVGRLALLAALPGDYGPLFQANLQERRLIEEERARFGTDHAEVGAWLARRWQLDPLFCDSLRYHHEDEARVANAHPLVGIVALAERLGGKGEPLQAGLWGLEDAGLEAMRTRARQGLREIAAQFGVSLPDLPLQDDVPSHQETLLRLAQATAAPLLAGTAMDTADCPVGLRQAYEALVRGAGLLFGTGEAALLLPEADGLRASSPDRRNPRLEEVRLRLPAGDAAIGRAFEGHVQIFRLQDGTGSLTDRHLARLLDAEALLCLPLLHASRALGVLVLGLDAAGAAALGSRETLLTLFAREAGGILQQALYQDETLNLARTSVRDECQLRARQAIHEVANPLGVLHNYLALLRERLKADPETGSEIDLMRDELRRVSGILQRLREDAGAGEAGVRKVDVNALVREVLELSRKGRPEMTRVESEFLPDERLAPIETDRDKLKQILINLVFNALEAMPDGGRLRLTTARWHGGRGEESVEIAVEDSGPGLPPEVLERLFAPGTSRKGGQHAGLGLAIVHRLAEELGAVIQCHSTAAGTRFKLLLPVGAESKGAAA